MKNFDSGSPDITTYHKYFKVKGHFFIFRTSEYFMIKRTLSVSKFQILNVRVQYPMVHGANQAVTVPTVWWLLDSR